MLTVHTPEDLRLFGFSRNSLELNDKYTYQRRAEKSCLPHILYFVEHGHGHVLSCRLGGFTLDLNYLEIVSANVCQFGITQFLPSVLWIC